MLNAFYTYRENKIGKELYFEAGADQLFHKSTIRKCCFANYEIYLSFSLTSSKKFVFFPSLFFWRNSGTQFSSGLRNHERCLDVWVEDKNAC